ncbi:MAG: hypothetical protein RR979_06950, partial [Mucinivorans sp.]
TVRLRNGETVIAEGIATGSDPITSFSKEVIALTYSRTDLPATSLFICFASSKDDNFDQRKKYVSYPNSWDKNWQAYVGSVLYVDDIELVYDK